MQEYQSILKGADFATYLAEDLSINACTIVSKKIILVNLGLLRCLSDKPNFANWDTVATVIAHEIAHTLYEKSSLLSLEEKRSRFGTLDMENQCDRDALLLMDIAGFNVRFGDLSFLNDPEPTKSHDLGILSTHPHPHTRNAELEAIRNNNYWSNYSETSRNTFTELQKSQISGKTPIETALDAPETANGSYIAGDPIQNMVALFQEALRRSLEDQLYRTKRVAMDGVAKFIKTPTVDPSGLSYGPAIEIPKDQVERFKLYEKEVTELYPGITSKLIAAHFDRSLRAAQKNLLEHLPANHAEHTPIVAAVESLAKVLAARDREVDYLYNVANSNQDRMHENRMHENRRSPQINMHIQSNDLLQSLISLPALKDLTSLGAAGCVSNEHALMQFYLNLGRLTSETILIASSVQKPEVLALLREAHRVFGVRCLALQNSAWLADISPKVMPGLLEELGSEGTILNYYQQAPGPRADKLFAHQFTQGILLRNLKGLISTSHIPDKHLDTENIRQVLHGCIDVPMEKTLFITSDAIYAGRLNHGLDLLAAFRLLAPTVHLESLSTHIKQEILNLEKEQESELAANLKKFWVEQYSSSGRILYEPTPSSAEEAVRMLKDLAPMTDSSDWLMSNKIYRAIHPELTSYSYNQFVSISNRVIPTVSIKDEVSETKRDDSEIFERILRVPVPAIREATFTPISANPTLNIPTDHLLAAARHGNSVAIIHAIATDLFNTLDRASSLWIDSSPTKFRRRPDIISESLITDFVGRDIEIRDFIFYKYLHTSDFADLRNLSIDETVAWMNKHIPRACEFRDLILTKVWYARFNNDSAVYNREQAQSFLRLFTEYSHRRHFFAQHIYANLSSDCSNINSACDFIKAVFPVPSEERDELFEKALRNHDFKVSEFTRDVAPYLSAANRGYARNKSIFDGTFGSAIDGWSHSNKREVVEWLFLGGPKPIVITNTERGILVKLDELVSISANPSTRAEAIKKLFLGANGLASGENLDELNNLIDKVLNKAFQVKPDAPQKSPNVEVFVRECIKATIAESGLYRREILINKLVELAASDTNKAPEEFIAHFMAAHSPAMIKGLQILASRPEIRKALPKLYQAAESCKSSAPTMSILDGMKAIVRNSAVRRANPTIQGTLGAASIKSVYKATFPEGEKALKVRNVTANKDVEVAALEISRIYNRCKPLLTDLFQIKTFPAIDQRVKSAIINELDLKTEIKNAGELVEVLARIGLPGKVGTPLLHHSYCDDNIIVEDMASGDPMQTHLRSNPGNEGNIARTNQSLFLRLLRNGVSLADLHQGNQFVSPDESITIIDTGSLFKFTKSDTKNFIRLTLGLSSSVLNEALLSAGLKGIMGDAFTKNEQTLKSELAKVRDLPIAERTLALLSIVEQVPDYYLPDPIYWSIIGLTKPFGLDRFYRANLLNYAAFALAAV
jgi:predicted unusual protein kinase regulating ubiquinone biosynthesis (AarF/ABC1/UbiB family)